MKTICHLLFASGLLALCLSLPLLRSSVTAQATGQVQISELRAFVYAAGGYVQELTAASTGYTQNFDANGYGSFGWQFNTPANVTLANARLVVFLDAELDRATTTFFNESGAFVGLTLPPGAASLDIKASSWEIDEPSFLFGNFAQHQSDGLLDQTNSVPANAPDDVALALGFALGTLPPNSPIKSFFFISQTDIGGLSQTDAASNAKLWFNGFINLNNPPQITAATLTRQQGSPATAATIATVSDDLTAAGNLLVTVTTPAPGIAVTNIANNNGTITANVAAACNAPLGSNSVGLTVTDGGGLMATANLTVNVIANAPPTLGNYPNAGVINLGAGATVTPTAPPADNGIIASLTATAPNFTGSFSANPTTGAVTITNAAPPGNYTVTVTATDNCGATATKTFTLTINGPPNIATQAVARQQGSPGTGSIIAMVADDLTAAGNLLVTASTPTGISVTNITNNNGNVSANITAACNAALGNNTVVLTVTDGGGLSTTANLTVNVTANTAPTLGSYAPASTGLGSSLTVTPSAAPSDNGSLGSITAAFAPGNFSGTVAINQTTGALTISNAAPVGNFTVTVTATDNCGATSTATFPLTVSNVEVSPGSVLFYNVYTSDAVNPNRQNTRIAITNTDVRRAINVHLFFVDGASCAVADAFICLTPNQTKAFLASDLDPGTTGYLVAVAVNDQGCPANANQLIGDEYVKFASGHAANLAAESFQSLAGLPACADTATTAVLNFDGVSYTRAPRVLALDNIPDRASGNDTLLVLNRVGGNLATGASTLTAIAGILYDDAERGFSFAFTPGTCQLRASLSNNFPRTAPRFEQIIPAGRSGWLKLWQAEDGGLLGAALNFNPNAATNLDAFRQGHNLHRLTLTSAASLTIPIVPPGC